jgi:hypothetical protein
MRIPRWLFMTLALTALTAVSSFAFWCWLSWPTRTLREFTSLLQQGRFEESNQLLAIPSHWQLERGDGRDEILFEASHHMRTKPFTCETWQSWCAANNLQAESQSIWDLIQGRQEFSFHREFVTPFYIGGHVRRGTVVLRCEPWATSTF